MGLVPALALTLALVGPAQVADPAWTEVEGTRATVLHVEGDEATAARYLALADAQRALPGLPPAVPSRPRIFLARDEAAWDRVTGGRIPEWGAGVAIPSEGVMVLPLFASGRGRGVDLNNVFRHEWAHLGLHEHLTGTRIPRWFDEGYAQWASGGWDAMEGWRLRVAFATGRAPSLDSLALRWPRDRADAELAYGLSATIIEYLVEESGPRGIEVLLARWPDLGFEGALRRTYGVTSGQLEGDWQKYVKKRYGWLLVLSHSALFWSALALTLFGMMFLRRRHNREAMARLRAAEGPDQPAFWEPGETPPRPATGSPAAGSWTGTTPPARAPWHIRLRRPPWLRPPVDDPGTRDPDGSERASPGYDPPSHPHGPDEAHEERPDGSEDS